jgi:hypothetical protein
MTACPARRYHFSTQQRPPAETAERHFFSIDFELVYEPFFADFGPLNLACTVRPNPGHPCCLCV